MNDNTVIETDRLRIYAASFEQMKSRIAAEPSDILKAAYTEMLNGCMEHPDRRVWYALWIIEQKDGTPIGELCFKGVSDDGITEIGYGIAETYRNRGYASEAVSAVTGWAFSRPEITCIIAETETGNTASLKVLKKTGFLPTGKNGTEGPVFACRKL